MGVVGGKKRDFKIMSKFKPEGLGEGPPSINGDPINRYGEFKEEQL